MKLTNQLLKHTVLLAVLLVTLLAGTTRSIAQDDLSSKDFTVTAEMLDTEADDYSEGGVDIVGERLYRYLQLGGDRSALTAEQTVAVEGYYDRYMSSPFFGLSNMWVLICAFLVFLMHLGFSTLESGLTQSKNTVNILFKNVFIISSGLLLYWLWGFNAMYPLGNWTIGDIFAIGSPWEAAGGPGTQTTTSATVALRY